MRKPPRAAQFALLLAAVALLCAAVAAVGPAKHPQVRFAWPPAELPARKPAVLWYTPLLLSRHEPAAIAASIPCAPAPPLPRATDRRLVLATTAGDAGDTGGLAVRHPPGALVVESGTATLARVRLPSAPAAGCTVRLELRDRNWSLTGPTGQSTGVVDAMPVVTGLFSSVDLRQSPGLSVVVTATTHAAEPRAHQAVLWALAGIAALAALLLPARAALRQRRLRFASRVGLPDIVVVVALLVWWVVGPAFFDDGWVVARQANYDASGGFSAYYSSLGVNLPLDYWLEWVEHWLVDSSSSLLILRVPALVCLLATWFVSRWVFARLVPRGESGAADWALAAAFTVAAFAWGMTLRPEPVLALIVAGVLACTVEFLRRPAFPALAAAAVLVALALSAHPAGIIALAPLLAAASSVVRWSRTRLAELATIVLGAGSLLIILATVGADLQQRRADVTSLRTFGEENAGWRDELTRYSLLSQQPYDTPVRRAAVALLLVALVAYVFRRRAAAGLPGLPARAVGAALLLLLFTPTKWPWHFGALIGLGAVAVAVETARVVTDARASRGWEIRPFAGVLVAVVTAAWAWSPRGAWSDLDLRTLDWTLGFESRLTLAKVAGALPLILLLVLAVAALRRRRPVAGAPWRVAVLTAPLVAVPALVFTVAVLVDDAARTDDWTLVRQNLDTLRGETGCGLADRVVVPARSSMHALPTLTDATVPAAHPAWLPPAPAREVPTFALGPAPAVSPWFSVTPARATGFFLAAAPAPTEELELQWGRAEGKRVTVVGEGRVAADAASDSRPDVRYWRFYAAADLPPRPAQANAVRYALRTSAAPGGSVGVSAATSYETEPLAAVLRRAPSVALPNLLMYLPCVRQPRVAETVAVPSAIVGFRDSIWPLSTDHSPFIDLPELYPFVRLPLSDSLDPPGAVAVYEVDRSIPGAAIARPDTMSGS